MQKKIGKPAFTPTRVRRWLTPSVALLAAVTLVAGCGGKDVEQGAPETAAAVDGAPADAADAAGAAAETAPEATSEDSVPAAPAIGAGTTATEAGTNAEAGTSAGDTADAKGRPAAGGGNSSSGSAGNAAGASAGSAVERLLVSHPIFGGKAPCKPATGSEVAIGNVSTLSGVLGELFAPVRPTLETFVTSQNACGGLNGHRIKIYFEDDQGDPTTAATKVQGLIERQKVLAFVGNIQVLTIQAIVPIIKKSGIPVIGGDLVSNTWFTNPLIFPQGSPPQGTSYGYLLGSTEYHGAKNIGDIWCIEVPAACQQLDRAYKEMAPQVGATVVKSLQASLTQPSFVQQCLEMKNAGVEAISMLLDAASMNRVARSCDQVGFHPKVVADQMGLGNQKQFLTGNKWLGNSYVPLAFFPWMADDTPALKYWHDSIRKYNPGFDLGGAASSGWAAAALLAAAGAELSATNPTTADLLRGLYAFQGQKSTNLGGLTGAPLTFREGSTPKIPYCHFSAISNAGNTGWSKWNSTAKCTKIIAPSDPQKNS